MAKKAAKPKAAAADGVEPDVSRLIRFDPAIAKGIEDKRVPDAKTGKTPSFNALVNKACARLAGVEYKATRRGRPPSKTPGVASDGVSGESGGSGSGKGDSGSRKRRRPVFPKN